MLFDLIELVKCDMSMQDSPSEPFDGVQVCVIGRQLDQVDTVFVA